MTEQTKKVPRRNLLGYVGTSAAGVAVGALAGGAAVQSQRPEPSPVLGQTYSLDSKHLAGIDTPVPAANTMVALDLLPKTDADALKRLLRMWTDDISALLAGRPVPGDVAPELAQPNRSLSVLVGFGPGVFKLPGLAAKKPAGFAKIPPMKHDRLLERWTGGDLLLWIASDDPTTTSYATMRLTRDAETFASLRWVQDGFWRATDPAGQPMTGRNLMGQVDGTANPTGETLAETLWAEGPDWFAGGTCLVVRRIEMNLETWDELTRERQEKVIGRRLSDGAPLTGENEQDQLDLEAKDDRGELVIPETAHARVAHPKQNSGRRMVRRGLSFATNEWREGRWNRSAGLIFNALCANVAEQFVPIQQRLDQSDALNEWTTAIGSAVFAIPPALDGTRSYLGEGLFD